MNKLSSLAYDRWQFANHHNRPVSAETCISFQDYDFMQTFQRKPSGERRLPTPLWAINDRLLRELLVAFMEERLRIHPVGPLAERRERIRLATIAQRPQLNARLDRLNMDYATTPDGPARRKELQIEVEALDTYIRTGGIEHVAAAVYLYYRCAMDSVGVAEEIGIKPPHVRQLLYKLHHCWEKRFNEDGTPKPIVVRERAAYVPHPRIPHERAAYVPHPRVAKPVAEHGPDKRYVPLDWSAVLPSMCDEGMSINQMAVQLGVTWETVRRALERQGLKVELRQVSNGRRFDWNLLPDLCATGMSSYKIAARLGVSRGNVRYAIKTLGLVTVRMKKKGRISPAPIVPAPLQTHA